MSSTRNTELPVSFRTKGTRSHSAQGLATALISPAMKIPLPPRMWITDVEDESSDDVDSSIKEDGLLTVDRPKVRSRFRHHKQRIVNVPIGIFWDIENCQVPRGCSAIDVVTAIRAKFLPGRREADFVVVCDVRKESAIRLQELNDAQVSLIHVCGTQKNAADEKLRQCMRRFGELHSTPASLLLISGDINFAADLSDFRHRKNMEVILVHKQNTSSALITCASSHYCYNELTADLPRNPKRISQSNEEDEEPTCEMEVMNLPGDQPTERVSRRLRRLADNCGGKVLKVTAPTALLRFPTPDHASRALKRMDGEDVFGRKISTRYARSTLQPTYSSDEGYGTATATLPLQKGTVLPPPHQGCRSSQDLDSIGSGAISREWALALQQLPAPIPPPLDFCPPAAPKPRKIRGTHGSVSFDQSGCSSSNSGDDSLHRDNSQTRAMSPWNSSASFSEQSDGEPEAIAELTVGNLPPYDPTILQDMLMKLFSQYVPVIRAAVWIGGDGPLATVTLRSEADARLAIARVHKRRLDNHWTGRRLELSLGRPSPAPNLDVLRARLRAILLDQKHHILPLLRLRDAYASRHCCALTTSDIAKVKDTVIIHEGFGRMVQLINLKPVSNTEMEEAPWKCHIHASLNSGQEDGSCILQPVYMEVSALAANVKILLENHGGILPLLSFVECYEATFQPLVTDPRNGVALELLLRNAPEFEIKDMPSRHLTWRTSSLDLALPEQTNQGECSQSFGERDRGRTAPVLEPMLALFQRELIDLLRTAPRCSIPFSKLIPSFHHHFGRQCRVADYGFTKLPDLLAALSNTIVVLGSGSSRMITISAVAQSRRWTSDLVKLLKAAPSRSISSSDIPELYKSTFGRVFNPVDYGVCTLQELMQRVAPQAVTFSIDGSLSLPRRKPTPEERTRIILFTAQAVELLCSTPNLRMEFPRFVPAYHAHFGRQLRVAHYGCVKLVELFEMITDVVCLYTEPGGERWVRLTTRVSRPIISQRFRAISPVTLAALPTQYGRQFGAPPLPDVLDVSSLEALVYASGGYVEEGAVLAAGHAPVWASTVLAVCAVLCSDRCVARSSTVEYVRVACRRLGYEPDLRRLTMAGVVELSNGRVTLVPEWRVVWRVARIFADSASSLTALEILREYTRRYEPVFPTAENSVDGAFEFLRRYREIFVELMGRWEICAGVIVARCRDFPTAHVQEDYSLHDTPPGQKGSRVFESPKTNIWCSPPASALPAPTALIAQDNKRRARLAAQFDAS